MYLNSTKLSKCGYNNSMQFYRFQKNSYYIRNRSQEIKIKEDI